MLRKAVVLILLFICCGTVMAQFREGDCRRLIKNGYDYLFRFMAIDAMREFQEAIKVSKEIEDKEFYADALFGAGQATWYAGNFSNAADTVKLAISYFPHRDPGKMVGAYRILSNIYDDMGDYENAFKAVQEAIVMNKGFDTQNDILSLIQMGKLYKNIGDYGTARQYYSEALLKKPEKGSYPYRELHNSLGELYIVKGQLDSAKYFYKLAFTGYPSSPIVRLRLGESYLLKNETDSASFYLDSLYRETRNGYDINVRIGVTIGMGKLAKARGELKAALTLTQEAFNMAMSKGIIKYRQEAAGLLASLYEATGDSKQALYYQKLYYSLKESTYSDMYRGQLYAFRHLTEQSEQAAALASLRADKKLVIRTMLIVALLAILAIAFVVFRQKNERLALQKRATELEMQALRAQMNPHFIFNCLSAINHFILNKDTDKASDYLTRFSRLVRMVLIYAGKESISLDEELIMLRLYLDMEQLRFNDTFEYTIHFTPEVEPSQIQIPCFILQPFCENAIWHGLLHKEGKGWLQIVMKMEEHQLVVFIRDNGIGLEKAAQSKTKTTEPMGQKLSIHRLSLFNRNKTAAPDFTIRDVRDVNGQTAGTEVVLRINIKPIV